MAVMNESRVDVLRRTGQAEPEILTVVEVLASEEARVRAERFRPDRERDEIAQAQATAAAAMAEVEAKLIARADKARDQDLAALETELRAATAMPLRALAENDAEFSRRLVGVQVTALDQVRRSNLAIMDAAAAGEMTDADDLVRLADEYLASGQPDLTLRMGRVIESRLQRLARIEGRKGGPVGPAFSGLMKVQDKFRHWRNAEAAKSPEVRRQSVIERHKAHVADIRRGVQLAGGEQMARDMARAATRAAVGDGPAPTMVMGPAFDRFQLKKK